MERRWMRDFGPTAGLLSFLLCSFVLFQIILAIKLHLSCFFVFRLKFIQHGALQPHKVLPTATNIILRHFDGSLIVLCGYLGVFIALSDANIIIEPSSSHVSLNATYLSVPLPFDASPKNFAPVSGWLVLANQTAQWLENYTRFYPDEPNPPIIIVDMYSGFRRPYLETKLGYWARTYQPKAVIIFGEQYEGTFSEIGSAYIYRVGIDTSEAKFPIVNAYWKSWYEIRDLVLNNTLINVTVTDGPENPWLAVRESWWWPTWMTISVVWALVNIGLCIFVLANLPLQRSLAVVVIGIELAANILKLPFFLDPYAGWWLPMPVITVFYTMHWPLHIASAIIVIFFWLELATENNLKTKAGFLTTRKWPAAVAIFIVTAVEFICSGFRTFGSTSIMIIISSAVYVFILLCLAFTYFYVYHQVLKFFSTLSTLGSRQELIRKVSLRLCLAAVTFLIMIVIGSFSATTYYYRAIGQSLVQFLLLVAINAGSTLTIAAFFEKVTATLSSRTRNSSTGGTAGTANTAMNSNTAHAGSSAVASSEVASSEVV